MYTRLKNVQILLSMLKKYKISTIVLSPGGSDFPIIRSFESDSFFKCYSVVDESSSPYVAAGISVSINEPVVVVCTSGTAAINFVSGIRWAYENNRRIIAITADRDPKLYGQMETQKVDQMSAFENVTCYNNELPSVGNTDEFAYCERVLNESFIRMNNQSKPVHINIPTTLGDSLCVVSELPEVRRIEVVESISGLSLQKLQNKLNATKRILIIAGQSVGLKDLELSALEQFIEFFNAVLLVDHLSNVTIKKNLIHYYRVTELISEKEFDELCPEIVITFGNNYAGERLKRLLRKRNGKVEHWSIDESGRIRDPFYCLRFVFKCDVKTFFNAFEISDNQNNTKLIKGRDQDGDKQFFYVWKKWEDRVVPPKLEYSSFLVAQKLCEVVEPGSKVYLSILMSTRQTQFFDFKEGVRVFSNIGALGIDGCTSTFIGGSDDENLCYLLVGDLSFFYDIAAGLIKPLKGNVRIVLVNNHCGGEFHFSSSNTSKYNIDEYVAAGHKNHVKTWCEFLGMKYISVNNEIELAKGFERLSLQSDKPVFMEVFTDADIDAQETHKVYSMYSSDAKKRGFIKRIRKIGTRIIGEDNLMKLYESFTKRGARRRLSN